ncbi:MAG TPA: phosphoribosylformylglycinamidine synthase subunit PurL [Candidatus Gastranaerophilales bacterium]|nr:phosphoribosylformylglycinamidine synthase subunit PurL [Candidatus Gastranaerophilales bacterium]
MKTMQLYKALGLTDSEYVEILKRLGREPNELETYLFSAMWSEHCGYKHSRKYLSIFPSGGAVSHGENAGGVQIGEHVIVFKVESHNHPSAVEPFQGAATGIGGIVRDILAIGARPIALLDSLKFGKITNNFSKHIFDGVVHGISHYGNCIGVPTVGGEVAFDEAYTDSPLVNVMCVGIVRKDKIRSAAAEAGNVVIAVGSHTGRDGIHGASFASKELNEKSKEDRPSVQIGDPFTKKVLIEATLEILELQEVQSCQDFGAAGLLSSSSEMAFKGECGIDLHLDKVHLREEGMQPWEIMLSESQERMLFVVKQNGVDKVLKIAEKYDIPASIIGETTTHGRYRLFWHGKNVADLPPESLAEGPKYAINEQEPIYIKQYAESKLTKTTPIKNAVEKIVSDPNFASKKWVYRQYDHTVGTRTAIKPGDAGAAGIWIHEEGGVVGITIDSNPRQVFLNPYEGGRYSIWEACRNLISGGFEPLGMTNCLNYGNPEKDEVAYQFVKSVEGLAQGCKEAGIPVASGNVSFYNESPERRVYPTPSIGIVGYVDSPKKMVKSSFNAGETLILIGKDIEETSNVGGSLYQRAFYDFVGGKIDVVDAKLELQLKKILFSLRDSGFISGCVDVSEGGLFGAVFEGVKKANTGFIGNLISINDHEKALFGEITGRYVISTGNSLIVEEFLKLNGVSYRKLGKCEDKKFEFDGYSFDLAKLYDLYDNSIDLEMNE